MGSRSNSSHSPDGVTSLPLQEFLIVLRSKGLAVGPLECGNVRRLLATRHDWSPRELRTVLRSVLARDPHERRVLDDCFFETFRGWIEFELRKTALPLPNLKIDQALDDFRKLVASEPEEEEQQQKKFGHGHRSRKETQTKKHRDPRLIAAASLLAVIVILLGLYPYFPFPAPQPISGMTPTFTVDPRQVTFGWEPQDAVAFQDLRVTADGSTPVIIRQLDVSGPRAEDFRVQSLSHAAGFTVAPGKSEVVTLHFTRHDPGLSQAELKIHVEDQAEPLSIPLRGERTQRDTHDDQFAKPAGFSDPTFAIPTANEAVGNRPLAITGIETTLPDPDYRPLYLAGAGGILLLLAVAYRIWLYFKLRLPKDKPAEWREDEEGERFSFRDIGGRLEPLVSLRDAKRMGDLLGFHRTDDASPHLDLPESVEATIRSGFPRLCYETRTRTREVVVIEDSAIHPDFRSRMIDEFAAGMYRTGVEPQRWRFDGRRCQIQNERGGEVELNDLPSDADAYVLLLVTDGRGFRRPDAQRALQTWARFPRVAWIDMREASFRVQGISLAHRLGIPVFEATPEGITSALRSLLVSGRQLKDDESRNPARQGLPTRFTSAEAGRVEALLGDALVWAADCSWLQPCSEALADKLRREFHPHLPATRMQRIFRLEGTTRDAAGFSFDDPTLATLKDVWLTHRPPVGAADATASGRCASQDAVLRFILEQIEVASPINSDASIKASRPSLAQLRWEMTKEWIKLSFERSNTLKRFAELAASPVGGWLGTQLGSDGTPGGRPLRLRFTPDNPQALARLARINPKLDTPPVRSQLNGRERTVFRGSLSAATVILATAAIWWALLPIAPLWQVTGPGRDHAVLLERAEGQQEGQVIGTWGKEWSADMPLRRDGFEYSIALRGDNPELGKTQTPIAKTRDHATVTISTGPIFETEYPMIPIGPGTFQMGSPEGEAGRDTDELLHEVTLTTGFLLGRTEVTQAFYQEIMGVNPSELTSAGWNAPVENVSWVETMKFCEKLTDRERAAGRLPTSWEYTLPTEAQWEYACRAGSTTAYWFGDDADRLGEHDWYAENSGSTTHPVGQNLGNAWGLQDMHGNVFEWCRDWYEDYRSDAAIDPVGPAEGSERVIRGGGWSDSARDCRSAFRFGDRPSFRGSLLGFRVAAVQSGEPAESETEGRRRAIALAWIPPGEFKMGSPPGEADRDSDEQQHDVTITQGFYMSRFEITQGQYEELMGENPSEYTTAGWNAPVERVSWEDAMRFCEKLTDRERAAGRLPTSWDYTLPTEAQWEYACRAGSTTAYWFGDHPQGLSDHGWYSENSDSATHPVGQKPGNAWGLHDMHGNVWEWCRDGYGEYRSHSAIDPVGPVEGSERVIRGGSWGFSPQDCRSAIRGLLQPSFRYMNLGFRVAAVQSSEPVESETEGRRRAIALAWIPPGEFTMGSPPGEAGRDSDETQHDVTITQGFYMSRFEITQGQYEELIGENPSEFKSAGWNAPVERVSWEEAMNFCEKLTERERAAGRLPMAWEYTLPTEAQWEYACRAGTTKAYWFGDDAERLSEHDWYTANSDSTTHPVGQKPANPWGLHDMHGNVYEWCRDWPGDYRSDPATDPVGPTEGSARVFRGGCWSDSAQDCRSAYRYGDLPSYRGSSLGFRVAAVQSGAPGREQASEPEGRR